MAKFTVRIGLDNLAGKSVVPWVFIALANVRAWPGTVTVALAEFRSDQHES